MPFTRWDVANPPFSFELESTSSKENVGNWDVVEEQLDDNRKKIRYSDPKTQLSVSANVRYLTSAMEWVLELENWGTSDSPMLSKILPLDLSISLDPSEQVVLHRAKGSECKIDDFLPISEPITRNGMVSVAPTGGRSSDGALPFMNLQRVGGGLVLAVGWSGQWVASFSRDNGMLRMTAGMEKTHLKLHPGEKIRTPRILLIEWSGDDSVTGNNLLRKMLLENYCPRIDGELVIPPIAHMTMSTFHQTAETSEANELDALSKAKELGMEAFWVDACWYGEGGRWWQEVGNWNIRREFFPRGLKPIGEAAHQDGMKFVLWFEPERVRKETPLAKEHPEFLLHSDKDPDNALFNLGLDEAREYITDVISNIIEESGVDIYRQDFNFRPLPFWRGADAPDRVGMSEIRHIEGLYQMWDDLKRRHPNLAIDNCASGGRRIDLETTSRSFPLWRSDFSDVGGPSHGRGLQIGDQLQTAGLSRWVPLHSAAVWSFSPYEFRSAMSSGIVLYCDIRNADFPAEDAIRALDEMKRLRPYFLGDFFPLAPLSIEGHDWCAYQFDRSDLNEGFAVFLRRHDSPFTTMRTSLKAIDSEAKYEVGITKSFDKPVFERVNASALLDLNIEIGGKAESVLLQYRRIG